MTYDRAAEKKRLNWGREKKRERVQGTHGECVCGSNSRQRWGVGCGARGKRQEERAGTERTREQGRERRESREQREEERGGGDRERKREWGREKKRGEGQREEERIEEKEEEEIGGGRERENSNSNSKTLILKDSNVRSIWTYLTASPCNTTNTKKHGSTTNKYYKHD